jgi:hypothetical protein
MATIAIELLWHHIACFARAQLYKSIRQIYSEGGTTATMLQHRSANAWHGAASVCSAWRAAAKARHLHKKDYFGPAPLYLNISMRPSSIHYVYLGRRGRPVSVCWSPAAAISMMWRPYLNPVRDVDSWYTELQGQNCLLMVTITDVITLSIECFGSCSSYGFSSYLDESINYILDTTGLELNTTDYYGYTRDNIYTIVIGPTSAGVVSALARIRAQLMGF